MTASTRAFLLFAAAAVLQACGPSEAPPPEPRPVRSLVVVSGAARENTQYTAEIRPRYETDLSFQVGGKLIARPVDVGSRVKRGDLLGRLDENDQRLAVSAAKSAVDSAMAELSRARTEEARFRDLLERGLTTRAAFLEAQTAVKTANSRHEQANAELRLRQQQLGYTSLRADKDGVITRIYAEVGSVVGSGQRIMSLAQPSELEAVFDVAETRVADVRGSPSVQITLLTNHSNFAGRVREVSPSADPVTRTYQVKTSIFSPPPGLSLGMTATVTLSRFEDSPMTSIPATALFQKGESQAVWVVRADRSLELRPVKVERYDSDTVLIASGLKEGDRIVTAGAHQLAEGQKVRLLDEPRQ